MANKYGHHHHLTADGAFCGATDGYASPYSFAACVRRDGVEPPEPKQLIYSQSRYPYGITTHVVSIIIQT